jgi:hypothetical protein
MTTLMNRPYRLLAGRFCGMTLSELGSAVGGKDYGAVCVGLKKV